MVRKKGKAGETFPKRYKFKSNHIRKTAGFFRQFSLKKPPTLKVRSNPEKWQAHSLGEQKILKILITGAYGNIGKAVIEEAHKRRHEITVFEIDIKETRKAANKYRKVAKTMFVDIRDFENVKEAVRQTDALIHLAAIIPPLSKQNKKTNGCQLWRHCKSDKCHQ